MVWIITGLIMLGGLHQQGLNKKKARDKEQGVEKIVAVDKKENGREKVRK